MNVQEPARRTATLRRIGTVLIGVLVVARTMVAGENEVSTTPSPPASVAPAAPSEDATPGPPSEPSGVTAPNDNSELTQALRLFQLDESVWAFLRDGDKLSPDEQEPVHRLLHVLSRLDAWQRHQWSQPVTEWTSIESAPSAARGRMVQLFGEAVGWQQLQVPPETSARYGHDFIYRIEIASSIDQRRLFVFARSLPPTWPAQPPASGTPRLPVRCDAIFLKCGATVAGKTSLYFGSEHLAWYPDAPLPPPWNVTADLALLGSHQFDATLLATLSPRPQLTNDDGECFHRLLTTTRRLALAKGTDFQSFPELPLEAALSRPDELRAHLFRIVGTARRALRVAIEDAEDRQRLGIQYYYEVECMVPTRRELVDRASGTAYTSFPVTLCIPELPDTIPQGDEIRVDIEATGVFLKLWSFQNDYLTASPTADGNGQRVAGKTSAGRDALVRQLAPLMIGVQIRPLPAPTASRQGWSSWALLAILSLAVVSAVGLWLANRPGDQRYQQYRRTRDQRGPLGDLNSRKSPPTSG